MALRRILAIEVTATAVRALRAGGIGPARTVHFYAERPLPSGLLVPSHTVPNLRDEPAFARRVAEVIGPRPPRRARLVLPDRSARLQVLSTDAMPDGVRDPRAFLLWRLKDMLPFGPSEARMAYLMAPNGLPTRRVAITLLAREHVLSQYERVLDSLGIQVIHAGPAAYHLFRLTVQSATTSRDRVDGLLALSPDAATVILSHGGIPHYARTFLRADVASSSWCGAPRPAAVPRVASCERRPFFQALAGEVLQTLAHAEEAAGLPAPARMCVGGDVGRHPDLAAALEEMLGISCILVPPPLHRLALPQALPPEAYAVLSAALAPVGATACAASVRSSERPRPDTPGIRRAL